MMSGRTSRVLVTQLGARRHYLVPAAFQQAGVLERFVTDFYSKGSTGRIAQVLPPKISRRLRSRQTADLPSVKIAAFPWLSLATAIESGMQRRPTANSERWIRSGTRFAKLCRRYLTHETTHAFAFTSAAMELFIEAKSRGVRCILDHATAPRRHEMALVREEQERFPDWGDAAHTDDFVEPYHKRQIDEAGLADSIICNSTFARCVLQSEGLPAEKIAVVPLGIKLPPNALGPLSSTVENGRLRILFVGSEALRKGVQYLVQALGLLGSSKIEARFVGNLGLSQRALNEVSRVGETTGGVPRAEMERHFRWADVLVLPSVSDTFGLVILEAMARGVPVIASENTGGPDVIRHGVDGFIVPVRDSNAIAAALDQLAANRPLLAEMSRNAADRAEAFSLDAYRTRIVEATGLGSIRD